MHKNMESMNSQERQDTSEMHTNRTTNMFMHDVDSRSEQVNVNPLTNRMMMQHSKSRNSALFHFSDMMSSGRNVATAPISLMQSKTTTFFDN